MRTLSPIQWSAIAVAGVLLVLQIILGLEYSAGGSLGTQASMIAAMVTLAILPVFIEAARRSGAYVIGLFVFVGFLAFLGYSLPATVGRTGEIKEVKVGEAIRSQNEMIRVRADYATTADLVTEANIWVAQECKTGNGKKCEGVTFILHQREASLEKLGTQLKAEPVKLGDVGSETWAWALSPFGVTAETIRRASGMSFAVGLDMIIWSLIWLGTSDKLRCRDRKVLVAVTESDEGKITDHEIEELRKLLARSRSLDNNAVADGLGVSKGQSSKLVSRAIQSGMVSRVRDGRHVSIRLN